MNVIQLNTVNIGGDIVIKKSEGGSESGGEYLYIDYPKISNVSEMGFMALGYAHVAKYRVDGNIIIRPLAYDYIMGNNVNDMKDNIVAIAIGGVKVGDTQSGLTSLVEGVKGLPDIDSCLITKEEFYTLTTE